mgnify:CR=1 FL=1
MKAGDFGHGNVYVVGQSRPVTTSKRHDELEQVAKGLDSRVYNMRLDLLDFAGSVITLAGLYVAGRDVVTVVGHGALSVALLYAHSYSLHKIGDGSDLVLVHSGRMVKIPPLPVSRLAKKRREFFKTVARYNLEMKRVLERTKILPSLLEWMEEAGCLHVAVATYYRHKKDLVAAGYIDDSGFFTTTGRIYAATL